MSEPRQCPTDKGGCGNWYPDTPEFWHRDGDELRTLCKVCRNRKEQEREEARRQEGLKHLDEQLRGMLSRAVLTGGNNLPHEAELYECIMRYMQGPQGFATHLMSEFVQAPPGSPIRQKYLDSILRMSARLSEDGDKINKQVEQMSDKELVERTASLLEEVQTRQLEAKRQQVPLPALPSKKELAASGPSTG